MVMAFYRFASHAESPRQQKIYKTILIKLKYEAYPFSVAISSLNYMIQFSAGSQKKQKL